MSVVLRPRVTMTLTPLMAGVAIAETIRDLGVDAKLKWPNDVLISGKKVGGILTESTWSKDELKYTIVGIGVNLNNKLTPDLSEATTLSAELKKSIHIDWFLEKLLEALSVQMDLLEKSSSKVIESWKKFSSTLGVHVIVEDGTGEIIRGVAVDIDPEGAVLIESNNGQKRVLTGSLSYAR